MPSLAFLQSNVLITTKTDVEMSSSTILFYQNDQLSMQSMQYFIEHFWSNIIHRALQDAVTLEYV